MKIIYRLSYEMQDGKSDVIESSNENEIMIEFEELKRNKECISVSLTKLYLCGGICQGEMVIDEFRMTIDEIAKDDLL